MEFDYDVFLIHERKDKTVIRSVAERLQSNKLRVRYNKWEIKDGVNFSPKIKEGLERSRVLVLCMSANSPETNLAHLEADILRFCNSSNKQRRVILFLIDDVPIQGFLTQLDHVNWFSGNREQQYAKLLVACGVSSRSAEREMPNNRGKQARDDEKYERSHIFPTPGLFRLASPSERRRIKFSSSHKIPPLGTIEAARLQRLMDMDVAFQLKIKALEKRLPHLLNARLKNGSGLQMSTLLRSYFLEYFDRYFKLGPDVFPTSFNVVESFMPFNRRNRFFDLRPEIEHLLAVNDYFDWYEKGEVPRDPQILKDLMKEGVIYSYDMISGENSFRISADSQQVFAGVSFIRHEYELSCLLLAGENPPLTSDEEVLKMMQNGAPLSQKGVVPDPRYTIKDRYLDTYPDFGKVIVLTRLDLRAGKHDVRYVNLDLGSSFAVFTDDFSVLGDLPPKEKEAYRHQSISGLERYDDLFAALSSMIYLPAFFAAFPETIKELEVVTELHAMRDDKMVKETIDKLGESECPRHRNIRCFPSTVEMDEALTKKIDPPQMEFRCDGYWKAIGPQEIGEGKNGEKIFGRTWVSRHESWSARSPKSFLLQRSSVDPVGPDPGIIYIQRSPAFEHNLYKVGLTKRTVEVRAKELSSATGVALPFGILASWQVGDCTRVEREIHQRLSAFRINPRREFFRAELSLIIRIVDDLIKNLSPG